MRSDLAIVGSGAAGFAAAIAARGRGLDVVMIETDTVGGTCVNTGCVPSKALLAAAVARHAGAAAGRYPGLAGAEPGMDFGALIGGTNTLVEGMRANKYADLAAGYGWPILAGAARFAGTAADPALAVELAGGGVAAVRAAHYLVATGSAPVAPPIAGLAGSGYLTSTTAMRLETLPASMIVLGGGPVGLEQAQLFARLGTRVTIVEALDRLAPAEEPEISAGLTDALTDEGVTARTGATVDAVARDRDGYRVRLADRELAAEQLLVATGRRPVTAGLNLAAVGVALGEAGQIMADERQRTGNPRIWVAGDVTGGPQYVYVAAAHGALVVDNAFGAGRRLDYRHLPRVTFTSPTVAAVGLTDAQAVATGYRCDCRVLPLRHVPRAIVDRDTCGLVKLVADADTGVLLGAHVLAAGAGEVITAAGYALAAGMTVREMAKAWSPYLTMAEALKLAAQSFTRDVAMLSCCAA